MLQLDYRSFADIPSIVIENQEKPSKGIVFAYHGWTNSKDTLVELGVEIAKHHLLVIMPDAYQHGQRQTVSDQEQNFIETLWFTSHEFLSILKEVQDQWGNDLPVYVAGISMGAILSGMLFHDYDFIQKAGILMGTLHLRDFLNELSHTYAHQDIETSLKAGNIPSSLLSSDLSADIDHIEKRQLYIWHSKNDSVVPFDLTATFVEQAKQAGYTDNIHFEVADNEGHRVPHAIKKACAEFLSKTSE